MTFGRSRSVSITVQGQDAVKRMIAPYADARQLGNKLRRAVRAGAAPMRQALINEARNEPTGALPNNFANVPAPKVSTRGGAGGRDIYAKVRPNAPLFVVFEAGAESHDITGGLMAGQAGARNRPAPFAARGRVRHPGMARRPILPSAYAAGRSQALAASAAILFDPTK